MSDEKFILLCWLITAHFVGDYFFQSRETAIKKSKEISVLCLHGLEILLCYAIVAAMTLNTKVFVFASAYVWIHCIQDWFIWRRYKNKLEEYGETFKYWNDKGFYDTMGLDSLLHILTILILFRIILL
jgi:hypothetical protein